MAENEQKLKPMVMLDLDNSYSTDTKHTAPSHLFKTLHMSNSQISTLPLLS